MLHLREDLCRSLPSSAGFRGPISPKSVQRRDLIWEGPAWLPPGRSRGARSIGWGTGAVQSAGGCPASDRQAFPLADPDPLAYVCESRELSVLLGLQSADVLEISGYASAVGRNSRRPVRVSSSRQTVGRARGGRRDAELGGETAASSGAALAVSPWTALDGPSLVCAAAALQLLPENIHHLGRLQRLAVIGASLPERPSALRLSPSRLRDLLKHPLVSGLDVRTDQDPYDDVYVVEVPFHGGPRRVLQGLTSQSAGALNLLLPSVLRDSGASLPTEFREQAELFADVLLALSEGVCEQAGLRRGTLPPERRIEEVAVPGQRALDALCEAVSLPDAELAGWPEAVLAVVDCLAIQPGEATWRPGTEGLKQLVLTPLLRTPSRMIIASPGELAAALRHHILRIAVEHDCHQQVAELYRETAYATADRLMRLTGAQPLTAELRHENAPLTRRRYSFAEDKVLDLIVVADDLSGYQAEEPSGMWPAPELGESVWSWYQQVDGETRDMPTLRLLIMANLGRVFSLRLPRRNEGPLLLMMRLDELAVITDLDGTDPLYLWTFAEARRRLLATTEVVAFSMLDVYALFRAHDFSLCLSDDRPVDKLAVHPDMGLPLRIQALQRLDVHQVPSPRRAVYVDVDVLAEYGSDIAPIYVCLGRHEAGSLLVEVDGVHAWVLHENPAEQGLGELFETVCKAAAYWLWQISTKLPGLAADASLDGELLLEASMDEQATWSRFHAGEQMPDPVGNWVEITCPRPGRLDLRLVAAGAPLLYAGHNEPDRGLLTALLTALIHAAGWPVPSIGDLVDEIAPLGPKRMMAFASSTDDLELRPTGLRVRRIQPAQTAKILDELGEWLASNGLEQGDIPDDARTQTLREVVGHYFQLFADAVAVLSPDQLIEQLIARDEAVIHDAAVTSETLVPRIACFGEAGATTQDLIKARQSALTTAVASRFLIEYVAAQPPVGELTLTLERYDYLLALAYELTTRGLLSDAIHHGLTDSALSLLPSGRLGVSRGDRYDTGTEEFRAARVEVLRRLALEPAPSAASLGAEVPDPVVEAAMAAEFGYTFEQMALGLGELVNLADTLALSETCRVPRARACAHLQGALNWPKEKTDGFLTTLTLEPREEFLSVKTDAYPWRFNRAYSYLRRPLVLRVGEDGEPELLWGIRRLWESGRYLLDLVYSGRLRARSPEMKRVCVTIRQEHNKDFERRVAQAFASSGCDKTVHSLARVNGRRLESAAGDDLGDIDALGIDTRHRLIVVGEAKDFEIARTPAEMSNEAEALVHGEKSAVFKTARRARWVREHLGEVLAHFGVDRGAQRWRVLPLIVTSRDLITPRVTSASVPIVAIEQVREWVGDRARRGN